MSIRLMEKLPDRKTFLVLATLIVVLVLWYFQKTNLSTPSTSYETPVAIPGIAGAGNFSTYSENNSPISADSEEKLNPLFPRTFIRGTDVVLISSEVSKNPTVKKAVYTTSQRPETALTGFRKYLSDVHFELFPEAREGSRMIQTFRFNLVEGRVILESDSAGTLVSVELVYGGE